MKLIQSLKAQIDIIEIEKKNKLLIKFRPQLLNYQHILYIFIRDLCIL